MTINNDGFIDLFVSPFNRASLLFSNNGDGTFTRILSGSMVTDSGSTFGAACADYDNDGSLDLFVTRFRNYNNALYRNNGNTNAWDGSPIAQPSALKFGFSPPWAAGRFGSSGKSRAAADLAPNRIFAPIYFQAQDAGRYQVIFSTPDHTLSVASLPAVLTGPVVILEQPRNTNVRPGSNAVFSVTASGNGSLTYQWRRNGVPLLDETNRVLTVLPDSDGDGLPDDWETAHGLDPGNPEDALQDSDGDGLSNRQEYRAGTDPGNGQSLLKLESIEWTDTRGIRLSFLAASNLTYSIRSSALVTGPWLRLADFPAALTNRTAVAVDPAPEPIGQRFYQLVTPAFP